MSSYHVSTALFVATLAYVQAGSFTFNNCDNTAPVQLTLGIKPDPIILKGGEKLLLTGSAKNKKPLPQNLKIEVSIKKKILFWIPIPCISNVGSCTYEISCKDIPEICLARQLCPTCKLSAQDFVVPLPDQVETKVPSFLVNGKYKIEADVRDKTTNARVGCVELVVDIEK